MKNITYLFLLLSAATFACPACEKAQPKLLRGITHGTGPESRWDYLIVIITIIIVLLCIVLFVKLLVRPGETNNDHIKNQILN